jgi:NAD/NADP transhydrogenase beta subunit
MFCSLFDEPLQGMFNNAVTDNMFAERNSSLSNCLSYYQVHTSKMGILYGIGGMIALIAGYWIDETYTYDDGRWLIAASMAPGIIFGIWSALSVEITGLPELVGAYNGFGGLAAALEGIGLYLDPNAKNFVREGISLGPQTDEMLWVQAIALVLSVVIGMMTFTGR